VLQSSPGKPATTVTIGGGRLTRDDEDFASELQKMYKVDNKSKIIRALQLLRALELSVVQVSFGQIRITIQFELRLNDARQFDSRNEDSI